ncbi:hypothetical protein AMIS_6350 [Actinoplanes missouriensis 431]|uniref:Uncharacterized protein n=1 Tax=Actinoplanes missouriensis (strain ATCC 14538 / DSM 43046 / CBS 188.64 / JCM 3121 / NBRC 102363 / NCIMB 12654 / NRRL B-3342 / UNCC 431) TaxID=512565 RepID=I0GYL8_ACTM4|nr:hypothetical protein [Actinoplanes missouriensis]BAL85855.1 hypothetical protein AMIS_6350 [Actinoplanes missouriensis 431]
MRYAIPTRPAHHAAHALVLRPFPITTGQHRSRAHSRRHLRREPLRTAHLLTRGLAALIVLGICVMVGVLIVADERHPPASGSSGPLTASDVFPEQASLFRASQARAEADCPVAVTGALRSVLQGYGCSQSIRAVLTVPYADYRVTAGVLTLPDTPSAAAVSEVVRDLVETGDGSFATLTGADTPPGTPVAWRTHDRYLIYCVIVSSTGELVPGTDPAVTRVTTDLLDIHLSTALPTT